MLNVIIFYPDLGDTAIAHEDDESRSSVSTNLKLDN